jgi:hypothetical protein
VAWKAFLDAVALARITPGRAHLADRHLHRRIELPIAAVAALASGLGMGQIRLHFTMFRDVFAVGGRIGAFATRLAAAAARQPLAAKRDPATGTNLKHQPA